MKYVIHAVGPRWVDYEDQPDRCKQLIANAYKNSLIEAERLQLKSIALPAISSSRSIMHHEF